MRRHHGSQAQHTYEVILCCSTAGLRSGRYAEGLLKEGFTDVRNLEGSILAWVIASSDLGTVASCESTTRASI